MFCSKTGLDLSKVSLQMHQKLSMKLNWKLTQKLWELSRFD